jgi:predicted thioesterase
MQNLFNKGDTKTHHFKVKASDYAAFEAQSVHKVCSTFALAREIEWSTRLFVLEMLDEDEEGIGTSLKINHKAPAFLGEAVEIIATFEEILNQEIICSYQVLVGSRLVAEGQTGQRILPKDKIQEVFQKHYIG